MQLRHKRESESLRYAYSSFLGGIKPSVHHISSLEKTPPRQAGLLDNIGMERGRMALSQKEIKRIEVVELPVNGRRTDRKLLNTERQAEKRHISI